MKTKLAVICIKQGERILETCQKISKRQRPHAIRFVLIVIVEKEIKNCLAIAALLLIFRCCSSKS